MADGSVVARSGITPVERRGPAVRHSFNKIRGGARNDKNSLRSTRVEAKGIPQGEIRDLPGSCVESDI